MMIKMIASIVEDELERFIEDYETGQAIETKYVDTLYFEDQNSHNDIEEARRIFIIKANEYLESKNAPYYVNDVNENVMLFDKETDKIVRNNK